jgi:hypothetical protein
VTSDLIRGTEDLLNSSLNDALKILVNLIQLGLGELVALARLTAHCGISVSVNCGSENHEIGPAKTLPVKVMALRVNAALG